MGYQVCGHQSAVAVSGDADAVGVHNAEPHGLIHRGLGMATSCSRYVSYAFFGSPTMGNEALSMMA